ncbi:pilus (MSHA type) biogenesis protein MshL [Sulfuriferula plumbiphila]|uniref:Pilus (MSHA type) biogenesis protein MshL n=1 Tax=Sulfuriferula plumbiphila TaxID=171865 RepID=A0A512L7L3_9PROT|nr:pilus (MSHA type) biogenesis protein MshL [Sulfuriferula plumbiphila]BBP04010.1 pilus (MSHA type) biogenesis protein MshL [Sulfuriferula plumbiphila]GEP30473.1 pilus (MSHA type) biogenesis protein MshL [Sulfuriferula plumbiphila]
MQKRIFTRQLWASREILTAAWIMPALLGLVTLALAGCATQEARDKTTYNQINAELDKAAAAQVKPAQPGAVDAALLPPLKIEMPKLGKPPEQRFDLVVNNAPANQVFLGIVSGTRYSMLVHPEVSGTISVNLKNVTVFEALDAIRELYGYDYKVDGTRIFIQPLTMQTRVFRLNYISGQRKGTSDIRVTSGSVSDSPTTGTITPGATTTTSGGSSGRAFETSKITTTTETDFWSELKSSLTSIIGDKDGRTVVVSPQSGVVLIRALPNEIRQVEHYLKATQLSVDRQVMLEAKIIEVQLNDGYQSGINWAAFNRNGQNRFSLGADANSFALPGGAPVAGSTLGSVFGAALPKAAATSAGMLNIAAQADNFAALISFLNTQGTVHVLSSPRIATLNNQMAVLKVGTDEFFVTNVSSTTVTGTATTSTPNVTLRPFFSGIALDVMPQISDDGQITLHVHPSVSQVSEKDKTIDLGGTLGKMNLPLASSTVSETDSVVRVQDGSIVAIGGLMQQSMTDDRSGVPVAGDVPLFGALFRHTNRASQKRELVILLKTTIVRGSGDWSQDVLNSRERIQKMQRDGSDGDASDTGNSAGRP